MSMPANSDGWFNRLRRWALRQVGRIRQSQEHRERHGRTPERSLRPMAISDAVADCQTRRIDHPLKGNGRSSRLMAFIPRGTHTMES
jgi:hypothetical protein